MTAPRVVSVDNETKSPLIPSGSLDGFEQCDVTPVIGTEFSCRRVQLSCFLSAQNSDALIRDLASLGTFLQSIFNVSFATKCRILP
jgi:hypothetical protein